ncbi:MAG: tetratricopeptide repeat protein [Tahibacter sp.]
MFKILSASRCGVGALLLACAYLPAVAAHTIDEALAERLVVVNGLVDGGQLDEGRLQDNTAEIERLPFVARGDRKKARVANAQGLALFGDAHYDQAAAAFERGLALDPADQEICNNLAFAYFRAGKPEQAWHAIKLTIALAPMRTSAWANIGVMRAAQGEHADSVWSFKNSYRFSRKPDTTRAYFEKLKTDATDSALQADLAAVLAAIDSGQLENWLNHPRPIGGLASSLAQTRETAEPGNSVVENELYGLYEAVRTGDKPALAAILAAANQGQPLAQSMIGEAYWRGYAVVEDAALSAQWYRRAAEQGYALAQYQLGLAYQDGRGVVQNYQTAARWYGEASAQNFADAMNNLGAIYSRGQIGPQDEARAAKLYRQASDLGDPQASYNLAIDYANGTGVGKNLAESARLYLLAANGGFVQAQVEVADNYENGRGVPKDEAQALVWYKKAATAGIEYARDVLKRKGVAD